MKESKDFNLTIKARIWLQLSDVWHVGTLNLTYIWHIGTYMWHIGTFKKGSGQLSQRRFARRGGNTLKDFKDF